MSPDAEAGAGSGNDAIAAHAALLSAAIMATSARSKAEILARAAPPTEAQLAALPPGPRPALPEAPGRDPAWRVEAAGSGRRRGSLANLAHRRRFLHAIFHIELSAVDLACALALWGLSEGGMPAAFHAEELTVAREEAEHAQLLEDWLVDHGAPPGTYAVHHRLWQALTASCDLGEALVVVPRYLEARGLDVAAEVQPRLAAHDPRAGMILARIHREEVGHVGIGTRWHAWWCRARGLSREAHFAAVVRRRFGDQLPSPFVLDRPGRGQAGFSEAELAVLSTPAPAAVSSQGSGAPPRVHGV